MPFYIGEVPAPRDQAQIKHICHIRETEQIRHGDFVEYFGHVLKWDGDCVTQRFCHQLQTQGDPLCDAALSLIFPSSSDSIGKDLYESLVSYVAHHPGENAALYFLREVGQVPPSEIVVSEAQVEKGRRFFLDHATQIMQALLNYSLAGGFASANIARTLRSVSYLVPSQILKSGELADAYNNRAYSRLLETFQFVLDVMDCSPSSKPHSPSSPTYGGPSLDAVEYLMPGGEGWRAMVRVRMLHAVARRRVLDSLGGAFMANKGYVPINQEELSATLGSFCVIPLWCLRRCGLPLAHSEAAAFLAIWRHVGYYLGVSPNLLNRHFSSTATADKFLASVVLDLFSSDEALDVNLTPAIHILRAVSDRPPYRSTLEYNCAVTRYLLGPELATHLGVPPTSTWTAVKLRVAFFLQKIPVWFARWYPRQAWKIKRREVLSEGMARSVRWNMGMRRTTFRPRTIQMSDSGGELAEGVKEAEAIAPDYAGARLLVRKWWEMVIEMVIVHAMLCGIVAGVALKARSTLGMALISKTGKILMSMFRTV